MMTYSKPFLLSNTGSDHATAYLHGNKCVSRDGKTHVVWTDEIATTCGRTYDHRAGQWSETVTLGCGSDDHNNPSLTMDSDGRLHLARSLLLSEWQGDRWRTVDTSVFIDQAWIPFEAILTVERNYRPPSVRWCFG